MNPSLFDGSGLGWGGSLCKLVNQSKYLAEEKMRKHLSSWITEKDIKMIKEYGFNSVRVPLGYWNIIPDPYERYAPLDPEISHFYLNWLFNITQKYNLTVILDLHGAPGSQNGIDHSGCSGMSPTWLSHDNINLSYQTIDKIMKLYSHNMNFIGIELLNEPNIEIELHHTILFEYYTNCYEIIRKYHSSIYILYNELYSQYFHIWRNEFLEPKYYNMIIDWHLYHWQDYYQSYTTQQHLHDIQQWKELINNYSQWNDNNIIIGEWSMSSGQYLHIGQEFVTETIRSFSHATWCVGWYVWNWKIDQTKLITSTSNNSLLAQQQQQQQSHHQYDEWDVSYQSTLPNGLRIPFV